MAREQSLIAPRDRMLGVWAVLPCCAPPAGQNFGSMQMYRGEHTGTLAGILDAMEDGVIVYDAAGNVAHMNAAMHALLASEAEAVRLEDAVAEVHRVVSAGAAPEDAYDAAATNTLANRR